jgi:hypothetical protein
MLRRVGAPETMFPRGIAGAQFLAYLHELEFHHTLEPRMSKASEREPDGAHQGRTSSQAAWQAGVRGLPMSGADGIKRQTSSS